MQTQTIFGMFALKAGVWITAALALAAVHAEGVKASELRRHLSKVLTTSVSTFRLKPDLKTNRQLR